MATIRALSGNWSLQQSFRRYFSCCFSSSKSKDGSTNGEVIQGSNDPEVEDIADGIKRKNSYGSVHSSSSLIPSMKSGKSGNTIRTIRSLFGHSPRTEGDGAEIIGASQDPEVGGSGERKEIIHVVPGGNKEGTAFGYEDQDTSSDSDDEVLRHYQQSIQRSPSKRSVHSTRSHKSSASKVSKTSQKPPAAPPQDAGSHDDQRVSMVERGDNTFPASSPAKSGDADKTSRSSHGSSDRAGRKASTPLNVTAEVLANESAIPHHHDNSNVVSSTTYANGAFVKDAGSPEQMSPTSTEQALSAYGEGSTSLTDEHLFDVSDLQDREPVLISKCGNLEVTFEYDPDQSRMNVTIHRAQDIPSKDRGGANNTQVRLLLLPTKKIKFKTKVKQGESPQFMETFHFKISAEEVTSMGLRFRLYGCERMRRERMIGEVVIGFASLNLDSSTTHMLTLEPRSNLSHGDSKMDVSSLSRSDSASSTQSMQHGGMPELLIGLTYNGTTGRLSVETIKGSNFKNMAMNRAPDTYVKLTLMSPNGQEIARSKTSLRRGQPNPLYKETFMFQVALFQLPDVTLMVSVYNKRSMKRKEMIGWFSLGYSSSGEEEVSHWNDMRESKGEPVCRWHVLLEA